MKVPDEAITVYEDGPYQVKEHAGRFYALEEGRCSSSGPTLESAMHSVNLYRNFWREKIAIKDEPTTARINGWHYQIGDESPSYAPTRGFGGERHTIRFRDGREVVTTNLWTQGEIPAYLRNELPDNAEFVKAEATR